MSSPPNNPAPPEAASNPPPFRRHRLRVPTWLFTFALLLPAGVVSTAGFWVVHQGLEGRANDLLIVGYALMPVNSIFCAWCCAAPPNISGDRRVGRFVLLTAGFAILNLALAFPGCAENWIYRFDHHPEMH